jgi:hypothetical protein
MTVSAVEELVERTYRALVTEVMKRVGEPVVPEAADRPARGKGGVGVPPIEGPVTVPFHKLSDEADLETRVSAVIRLLLAKRIVSADELEEEVRQLMRRADDEGGD